MRDLPGGGDENDEDRRFPASTLPAAAGCRTAWAGFDVLLISALTATAVLGWRRHPAGILPAAVAAVLLVCDAWFDVSLDVGTPDIWLSAALALFVELPVPRS